MGELNPSDIAGGERPSVTKMFGRAALRRCPRCGAGHVFTSWWTMKECCPNCNLHFEGRAEEGHFLGAMTINIGLTATILLLGIWFYVGVLALSGDGGGPPVWFVVVTSAALAVILPVLFYPFTKTIWVAAEITMNRMDPDR
ncbi:MAG TPA: hypothetical protein VGP90_05155 [Acidimicrobiia bacterium]|nr:hypothetical protein [Acidimicrobiia bacterium]